MRVILANSAWSMQPDATTSTAAPTPSTGSPSAAPQPSMLGTIGPFVVILVVFYFLLLRPQQKRQREMDDMLKALRKGDKVRTSGGIKGEVLEITETEVILKVDEKVKLNVLRSHIAARLENNKSGSEAKAEEAKPNG